MPRVSACFFLVGALVLIGGMVWGTYMAATHDHSLFPAHAHMNLIAGVLNMIYGAFYGRTKDPSANRRAWIQFVLHNIGMGLFIYALIPILKGDETLLPVESAGQVLVMLGILIFVYSALRELFRKHA